MKHTVPTTLFKSVHSSSHKQPVPTCMNKPVNKNVQAGQLNHVLACRHQPCSSLSTGKNRLHVFTCVVLDLTVKYLKVIVPTSVSVA